MRKLRSLVRRMARDEEGQSMVEYGLIIALIAVVVIAALILLGPKIAGVFNNITANLP